jgi:hypothetical protein
MPSTLRPITFGISDDATMDEEFDENYQGLEEGGGRASRSRGPEIVWNVESVEGGNTIKDVLDSEACWRMNTTSKTTAGKKVYYRYAFIIFLTWSLFCVRVFEV